MDVRCGLVVATLACAALLFGAQRALADEGAVLLSIEGAIGPATAEYVHAGLDKAAQQRARIVVLRLDTPGGLDSAMRAIIRDTLESSIPVVTYVSPRGARAASAGTYIMYASHLAAMAPSTHLGAATPVQLGGIFGQPDEGKEKGDSSKGGKNAHELKAVNDAAAYIRGLAELRGRNAEWAEKAVREAATLTASEALAQRVIEIVAADVPDLLAQADGRTVKLQDRTVTLATRGLAVAAFEPDWRMRLLATITNPTVAYLLLLIGMYGLLFEFLNPGAVAPGVVGGVSLLVGLYALNLLPVSYAGVALLLLGVALMVAEAFLPSFGILGLGGIVAFAVGSLLLFPTDVPGFHLSWPVVATATLASAAFLMIALAAAWRAHRRRVVTGEPALIGSIGKVMRWTGGEGEVHVHGERWHAVSSNALAPGQEVRIRGRRNLTLLVEPSTGSNIQPEGN